MTDWYGYPYVALTGGGDGALDSLDGAALKNGDFAVVVVPGTNKSYIYTLDADSGATEYSPYVIQPDANAGTKRWVLTHSGTTELVNVRQLGAVGDGVVDDTAIFTSAAALGYGIYVPPGSYYVTSVINGNFFAFEDVTILGGGAVSITRLTPAVSKRFQVAPNKTILDPNGNRFIARGVQMFDYLFVSFEARTDYTYRKILEPAGKGPGTGISEPTYYARVSYIDADNVDYQIRTAKANGANLIRVGVEYALMLASVSYVDPNDAQTYPSDIVMLDTIISTASKYGVVVQLQCGRDEVLDADNVVFLKWLAKRYYDNPYVWINPANEPNGVRAGGADVNDADKWEDRLEVFVTALRDDIAGRPAGTKFLNPVCIDPPGYAERVDLIDAKLQANAAFTDDPNLIINIHIYQAAGEADFRTTRIAAATTRWFTYVETYCMLVGEFGIDNQAGRFDPDLDVGEASVDLVEWGKMQTFAIDLAEWLYEQVQFGRLNGCIGHLWFAYIPGLSLHDDNSMRRQDNTWSTWGGIFRDHYLSPAVSQLRARRGLGANYTYGQWATGDITDDAVTNAKLANMATSTIKGRVTAGTESPEDLTSLQVLQIIGNLGSTRVGDGTIGTPTFQAESTTGSKAAGAFVGNGASDVYVGLYNRNAGALVGTIVGNGGVGVNYTSVSDERLKDDPRAVDDAEAIDLFKRLRPVKAGWKGKPEVPREIMFIAHEIQEVLPGVVAGRRGAEKDGVPIYQSIDYGKITPVIVAALQAIANRLDSLERKMGDK